MNFPIEFAKLSGSGNDFLCIDNRDGRFDAILSCADWAGHFARTICHRGTGLGADGVIFACQPEIEGVSDIAARLFEPDGSEAELCGNGTACFVHWVINSGWVQHGEVKILTPAGVVRGSDSDGAYIRVCIPDPQDIVFDVELNVCDSPLRCDVALTGVPHAVVYVDDVDKTNIGCLGPAIRRHGHFQPRGVNANFVQVLQEGLLAIRTWEFGVEGETLACGTGSATAAILAAIRFEWDDAYLCGSEAIQLRARSGDILRVYFVRKDEGTVTDVCLETVVRFLCCGTTHPDLVAEAIPPAVRPPCR